MIYGPKSFTLTLGWMCFVFLHKHSQKLAKWTGQSKVYRNLTFISLLCLWSIFQVLDVYFIWCAYNFPIQAKSVLDIVCHLFERVHIPHIRPRTMFFLANLDMTGNIHIRAHEKAVMMFEQMFSSVLPINLRCSEWALFQVNNLDPLSSIGKTILNHSMHSTLQIPFSQRNCLSWIEFDQRRNEAWKRNSWCELFSV